MALVESSINAAVCTITLADEANRNALSSALLAELSDACDAADADPEVRVVVLTNRGRVFCAGADLRERSASGHGTEHSSGHSLSNGSERRVAPTEIFARFGRSPKPYVGRLAGHCVAGGMGLAAAMDISIAPDWARFGFTEVRVGVAPAMISVLCLPKMSRAAASAAFLRGNRFDAAGAARLGLINAAVPAGELDREIDAVVADLLAGSPEALAACKQLLARVPEMAFADALEWTERFSAELFAGDDAREGMAAFLEKRPPRWAPEGS